MEGNSPTLVVRLLQPKSRDLSDMEEGCRPIFKIQDKCWSTQASFKHRLDSIAALFQVTPLMLANRLEVQSWASKGTVENSDKLTTALLVSMELAAGNN